MKVKVIFFGILNEITGKKNLYMSDIQSSAELEKKLFELFPKMKKVNFKMACNKKIILGNFNFKNNDEIAMLPPFSGG